MLLQLEPQMKSHKKKKFKRIICGGETGRTTVVFWKYLERQYMWQGWGCVLKYSKCES